MTRKRGIVSKTWAGEGELEIFGVSYLMEFLLGLKSIINIFLGWIMIMAIVPIALRWSFELLDKITVKFLNINIISRPVEYLIFILSVFWIFYAIYLIYFDIVDPNETRAKMYERAENILPW